MQKYYIPSRFIEGDGVNFSGESIDMVKYTDAEADKTAYGHASLENGRKQGKAEAMNDRFSGAEMLEARKQGYEEGRLDSRCVEYSLDVARKQGVQEERDRIFRYLSAAEKESYSRETIFELRAIAESLYDGTRGASEPRCTCGGWELRGDIGHLDYCPCYKEPRCTCKTKIPEIDYHSPGCPCYKPKLNMKCTCEHEGEMVYNDSQCPSHGKPPAGILHNPCMCPECRKTLDDPLEKLVPVGEFDFTANVINALVDRVNWLTEGK